MWHPPLSYAYVGYDLFMIAVTFRVEQVHGISRKNFESFLTKPHFMQLFMINSTIFGHKLYENI